MKGRFREENLRSLFGGLREKHTVYIGPWVPRFQDKINLHYLKYDLFSLSTTIHFS